jgi:hypothetical protein
VVLVQLVQEHGAVETHTAPQPAGDPDDHRQEQVTPGLEPPDREQVQAIGQDVLTEQDVDQVADAHARHAEHHQRPVDEGVATVRADHGDSDGQDQFPDEHGDHQRERRAQPLEQYLPDRLVGQQGPTEVEEREPSPAGVRVRSQVHHFAKRTHELRVPGVLLAPLKPVAAQFGTLVSGPERHLIRVARNANGLP